MMTIRFDLRCNSKAMRVISGIAGLLAMLLFNLILMDRVSAHKGSIMWGLSLLFGIMVVVFAVVYCSLDGEADAKDVRQDLARRQGIYLLCILVVLVLFWLDTHSRIALWSVAKQFLGLWGGLLSATSAFFWLWPYRRLR